MKSINLKLFCSTLLLLFFISSCTFEKRVYRPGYRIEWRKNKSFSDEVSQVKVKEQQQENLEQKKSIAHNLETFSDADSLVVLSLEQEQQRSNQQEQQQQQQKNNSVDNPVEIKKINREENLQEMVPLEKVEVIKDVQGISDSGGSNKGLYMILLSLLLFGLGLIFFLYLGVFGLILFIIFSIAAAIYFIVGLFMLIF